MALQFLRVKAQPDCCKSVPIRKYAVHGGTNVNISPFLQYVKDRESFDIQIQQYVATAYSQQK
jgi:hypothetical protein